jgi:hypothetical protein
VEWVSGRSDAGVVVFCGSYMCLVYFCYNVGCLCQGLHGVGIV